MKRILVLLGLLVLFVGIGFSTGQFSADIPSLKNFLKPSSGSEVVTPSEKVKVVQEESVITDAVDKVSPSVVTISMVRTRSLGQIFNTDPFNPFNVFVTPQQPQTQNTTQDIGTGFVISQDGIIITNKHVVSDTESKYKIVMKDNKTYDAAKIYRDPSSDLAIIKIDANNLTPVTLGDSSKLKVGQMAIAIGTALGEFRNTVTVGVISGLGRGITAGSPIEGSTEQLDNVIQTDAAINPGNSGGPLLNSAGQVIGINTAISTEGQNIGFALPINLIKDAIDQFNQTGKFSRPYIGVRYKMITKDMAITYEVPEGAYVQDVIKGSPAEKAGIEVEDVITKIGGRRVVDSEGGLSKVVSGTKVGDRVSVDLWRNSKTLIVNLTIGENTGE